MKTYHYFKCGCVFFENCGRKKSNVMKVNTYTVICLHNVKVKSFTFLVFRDLSDSWRKNVFLCLLYSKCFDIRWALYSELPKIVEFIDTTIDKTFSSRNNYELVSVVSKFVAPKILARKLSSSAGKLWKTTKIHFLYFFLSIWKIQKIIELL